MAGADFQALAISLAYRASRLTKQGCAANSAPLSAAPACFSKLARPGRSSGMVCCCSSVVERILGKAEVGSSILPSSTIPLAKSAQNRGAGFWPAESAQFCAIPHDIREAQDRGALRRADVRPNIATDLRWPFSSPVGVFGVSFSAEAEHATLVIPADGKFGAT